MRQFQTITGPLALSLSQATSATLAGGVNGDVICETESALLLCVAVTSQTNTTPKGPHSFYYDASTVAIDFYSWGEATLADDAALSVAAKYALSIERVPAAPVSLTQTLALRNGPLFNVSACLGGGESRFPPSPPLSL